ncbi:MAG TPA: hypothetical protein PKA20_21825 [Burkholderiaceae bacterium]|nr:hypothetical protein [Burkholderiaceae bacterium]
MVDLHCHYLPAVDDGARTLEEALELARAAVADGIETAVLTPHIHPGRYQNTLSTLKTEIALFRAALVEEQIPLKTLLGGEVRLMTDSLRLLDAGELPIIGTHHGKLVVLLEFPHDHLPVGALSAVRHLRKRGVGALIAHPERNRDIMRDWRKLEPFISDQGALAQVTAGSLCGEFGKVARDVALRLVAERLVRVVASDAHNLAHRPPLMREARAVLVEQFGEKVAERLTRTNPTRIVEGNFNG